MEGISYYLSRQELKNIIASFQSKIPREIFKIVQEHTGLNEISCYTKDELKRFFNEIEGDLTASYSMVDMEFERAAVNTYFKKPNDGWIECVIGKI